VVDNEHNIRIKVGPDKCFPGIIHCRISHVAYSINQSATESRSGLKDECCNFMEMLCKVCSSRQECGAKLWARVRSACAEGWALEDHVLTVNHIGTVIYDTASS
jgi:hypothetical protein